MTARACVLSGFTATRTRRPTKRNEYQNYAEQRVNALKASLTPHHLACECASVGATRAINFGEYARRVSLLKPSLLLPID